MTTLVKISALAVLASAVTAGLAGANRAERTVAKYSTNFEDRLSGQVHNARLAARKLNGALVPPGGELSFNKLVGSWSRDQGYKKAPVSFSGTLVDTWGGGVCQTSTTLYNAGLLAGMEVVERHHHQFAANYVPPGRDAAVAFPNLDLRLRNPYQFPLRVFAKGDQKRLVVEIRCQSSVPVSRVYERVTQLRSASKFELGHGSIGRVRNPGKNGYQVQVYRVTGGRTEWLSSDSYPAMSRVVEYR